MHTIQVTLPDGRTHECPAGTIVETLAPPPGDLPYLAARVNNDLCSLTYPLTVNSRVQFLTAADRHGWRVYVRSVCFLLAKAVRDLYPEAEFRLEHSFGAGLYCSFHNEGPDDGGITEEQVVALERHLHELIEKDLPIQRRKISFEEAVEAFEAAGQDEKLNLLAFRNPPRVVTHWCDGFQDLAHGPLAPSSGRVPRFALIYYAPGFVVQLPEQRSPAEVPVFEDQPHLFQIFQEHKEWGRILGVNTAGRLNEIIVNGKLQQFIETAEALHEKKVAKIADTIAEGRDRIRLILVAGPSSAGKTTFAKRLSIHLRVNGIRPVTLATDDYFVGADRNPLDGDGNPDYEHLEAVDLDLFNDHLVKIVDGQEVEIPTFNFETKEREYRGRTLKVEKDQVVIIEGIHGLNPRLTERIPADCEFKIYVNAFTQLSIDANNRISTTDNRLMRRMVRDHKYRGHRALETLRLWSSVRRGEKRWIFPFQKEARATFNSALDYELAVLKPLVEPLLMQVKPMDEEYAEARRLSEFLLSFLGADGRSVPRTSILREYIGGSSFRY
jgi:uridine kinase